MSSPRINLGEVASLADLKAIIEADCGPPNRGRKYLCPFHHDTNPSLNITPDGKHWKCWSCGAGGDALEWLVKQEGLDVIDAAKKLDPTLGTPSGKAKPRKPLPPPPKPTPAWHYPSWQMAASEIIERAESTLWSGEGRAALDWLRARGLDDSTIGRFRLGFNAANCWTSAHVAWPDGTSTALRADRGIVIPWCAPGSWYGRTARAVGLHWCGVNVRRLNPDVAEPWTGGDKCRALRGSERGHFYPWPDILDPQPTLPALLVEGEIDALVGVQEAGWLAHVGTVGGATQGPHASAAALLALCPRILVATDYDAAGAEAARAWRDRYPHKARRPILPFGKDLADFHVSGGNVCDWLAGEIAQAFNL